MALRHSRQRDAIWNFLRDRKDHPTAADVYAHVQQSLPGLSLGTVYRNLELMRGMGMLRTVDVGDGLTHYDPQTGEHDHFVCTSCGAVSDLPMPCDRNDILRAAARSFCGQITGFSACFYGLCPDCASGTREGSADPAADGLPPSGREA